jgi:pimeloyl-ACP methyl ester carboxylesterase
MIERVVKFGSVAALNGVLAEPSGEIPPGAVAPVILINSGILHKVGACRLYVRLARALADVGIPVLRFDLSGLGDSEVRRDSLSFEESAVAETREAMDYLARIRGHSRFILGGLCSGADVAHMTALVDERVAGMAAIDARTHVTPGFWWHNYAPKLLKPEYWVRWIRHRLPQPRSAASSGIDEQSYEIPQYVRVIPPRDVLADELRTIQSRGTKSLYLFTDGLSNYNHEGQHRRAFSDVPFGADMQECHLRGADHIVTDARHQEQVIRLHVEWASHVQRELARSGALSSLAAVSA